MKRTLLFLVSGILWAEMDTSFIAVESPGETSGRPFEGTETAEIQRSQGLLLLPQVSVVSPQEMTFRNGVHETNYSEKLAGLPALHMGVAWDFGRVGAIDILGFGRVGIAAKELSAAGIMDPSIREGGNLRLLWVPAAIGTEVRYPLPGLPSVAPSLSLGVGMDYLYQSGTLDTVTAHFFVPTFFVNPGLFFSTGGESDWFRGFNFGVSYHGSFSSPQTLRAWSFDLGIKAVL